MSIRNGIIFLPCIIQGGPVVVVFIFPTSFRSAARSLTHAFAKVKVPKSFVRDVVKEWKASEDWETEYSQLNPVVPEYFPALMDFKVDDGRIYALTPAQKDGLYEIVVMDLEGNILEREFRFPLRPNFEEPFFNGFRYDIEGEKLVWFSYNDAKNIYELHIR